MKFININTFIHYPIYKYYYKYNIPEDFIYNKLFKINIVWEYNNNHYDVIYGIRMHITKKNKIFRKYLK